MGIHTSSKLFVGAARSDIKCDSDILNNAIPEGMTEEEADELPYIDRISPYYDADSQDCYYGITVSCDEIMNPGGVEMVQDYQMQVDAFVTCGIKQKGSNCSPSITCYSVQYEHLLPNA
jgi:hypothetical protein